MKSKTFTLWCSPSYKRQRWRRRRQWHKWKTGVKRESEPLQVDTIHEPANQIKRFTCKRNLLSGIAFCVFIVQCKHNTHYKKKHFSICSSRFGFDISIAMNEKRKSKTEKFPYVCSKRVFEW